MELSEAVYAELDRRGGALGKKVYWGRWAYGPDPIEKVTLSDYVALDGDPILFVSYLQASARGAWDLLLDAIVSAVAAEGLDADDVILMLEATKETDRFWERKGFRRFESRGEALEHCPDLSLDMLTPRYARLSEFPSRRLRHLKDALCAAQ